MTEDLGALHAVDGDGELVAIVFERGCGDDDCFGHAMIVMLVLVGVWLFFCKSR